MDVKQRITAEQLFTMPEEPGKQYELVGGELVEVSPAGALQNLIAALIYELIRDVVREQSLGLVFTDGLGYILARNPDLVRAPDVSFVSRDRIPSGEIPNGFLELAPDLAVEVVSPDDSAVKLHNKVREYQDAGCSMVWVVWPDNHEVTVYAAGGEHRELGPNDDLNGGDVLPGFQVRVADLFEVG